jgi:aspartate/methionine/tyrosine aminotransferase
MFTGPDLHPLPGRGGCFFLIELDSEPAEAFCARLIESHGVAVAPGTAFWQDREIGNRYIRVAFNKAGPTITEAARRLSRLHETITISGSPEHP